ncbi:MAG: HTTM domain-containing protein [Maribacter sp.]
MLSRLLFQRIDNSPLIIFRIFFGILISLECFGAIATGWVRRNLVEPTYNFPFIDFEWLQPLPGLGMYFYFAVMGLLGILISLGWKYRISIISFTLLWTGVYLMQKTAYNNHYYLLVLICFLMCFLPANRSHSLDVRSNPGLKTNAMYGYVKWIIVLQLFIVYTYAAIAKMYGDWLDFSMIEVLMKPKKEYPIVGGLLQEPWVHQIIGTAGILFDLFIVPALLWKPTRKIAFVLSIFFHLFNSIIFQIGIFPYLSLAFSVFFFEPETIRNLFFKKKEPHSKSEFQEPSYKNLLLSIGAVYFTLQVLLPLRHYAIADNILWTEEGHRLSWRMMLRSRSGKGLFTVVDKNTKEKFPINPDDYLTKSQKRKVYTYPDFTWQFAQHLEREFEKEGKQVSVYLKNSRISINGKPYVPFINDKIDLASEKWNPWKHHDWILPSNLQAEK